MSPLEKCLFSSATCFFMRFFVFLMLSCMSCLYILEINPLSVFSFANICSHSEGFLFSLFMISFARLLSSTQSHLFIFYYSRKSIKKDLAAVYVMECSSYVFL